ncbi:MAG: tetratricopeptide repeat protein [Deltaproteobacteria bacterium]|nr:MAG: tetratricopeptide repeat protein [Deltaproteobacteria bacterium]
MQLPCTFGKYELLERIATGGMAEVYLARTFGVAGFEKRLVIKRIRPELAGDPHHISLFINEARIGVQLNHENVVQVYDLGKVGRDWYIAMEHLAGRDLNKLVKALRVDGERLPVPVAVHVVAEVCRGLAYAHAMHDAEGQPLGVVHRDVSPHNVLLTFAGAVKLVDFGIARLVGTKAPPLAGLPSDGSRKPGGGKYAYMSPEQARGEEVDHRTDVFSAGIVLWELLVGHRMYRHDDPAEKLRLVQSAEISDPTAEGIHFDPDLARILDRALAPDRAHRYKNAALLEEDLRAWLYERGEFDPRRVLVSLLQRAFPAEAQARTRAPGLERMLADVARLGDGEPLSAATPAQTPSEPTLPDPMRPKGGERKRVVALFVDIDGMTDLSLTLEPEDLFRRRYGALRWLRQRVATYDGHLQRVVDDQVLILFGVPRTRSDDLARAIECAMDLRRTVSRLREKGLELSLAMGVHAGDVTVDLTRKHPRYVARGDTTRFARRLAAYADHGEILISQRVLDGTQTFFRVRSGPALPQRGQRPPRPCFLVDSRRHGLRAAGKGPWLRRGDELQVLRRALEELQAGRGTTLVLTGEIGSGKSRLARELRDLGSRRAVPVHLASARPWGNQPPLEVLRDMIIDILGLEADAPRQRLIEAAERLPQLGLSLAEVHAIETLLRIGDRSTGRDEILRAVARTIAGLARETATILIFEDLHHLPDDEPTALRALIERCRDLPVLFLLSTTGPAPASVQDLGSIVSLDRFAPPQLDQLLRALLEVDHVDSAILDLANRTCEGNPLYVEEMVKYLLQGGHLTFREGQATLSSPPSGSALPDSIAGLIAARIDALEPAAKGALQLAAVIGQTFTGPLLASAMGIEDPMPVLTELISHGLVRRTDLDGAKTWTFSSEFVREAALRSTLGVQKRTYHQLISQAMEDLYADGLDPHLEALAAHCASADRAVDAARYVHLAGKKLEDAQLLERARELYERGLSYLRDAPQTPETWDPRVQGEAMLNYRSGAVSRLLGDEARAERSLQLSLDISSDAGLPWIEIRAHLELGRLLLTRGKILRADAHISQADSLSRIEGDRSLRRETIEVAAYLAYERGDNATAESLWAEALDHAGGDPGAIARCKLGMASRRIREGELDAAESLLEEALEGAKQSNDRILLGRVLNNLGLMHYWSGRFDEALSAFRRALRVREGIGYSAGLAINHHNIGDVHFSRGDLSRAWVAFARSREIAAEMDWHRGVALNDVYLGYIEATRRNVDEGLARIVAAIQAAERLGDAEVAANGGLIAARLLHDQGRVDEARAKIAQARTQAEAAGLRVMIHSLDALAAELDPSESVSDAQD